MRILKYIIVSIIFFFSSCEKAIQFNLDGQSMIVVNSLISTSGSAQVKLSMSIDISEKDTIIYLENAGVSLYCDSIYIEELEYEGKGLYKSIIIPEAGKEYNIKVTSDNFPMASSSAIIPPKPLIISSVADISPYNGFDTRLCITINDDSSVNNYYLLSMKGYLIEYDYTKVDSVTNQYVIIGYKFTDLLFINNDNIITGKGNSTAGETLDAIVGTSEVGNEVIQWIAFSDHAINGSQHTIETHIVDNIKPSSGKPIYVMLKSITEDYYKYLKSKYYAENAGNNPFSEPVKVYNNIEGGVGIFAAYNLAVDSIVAINSK